MKVFLRTYGCRANHYDSEQIKALLGANAVQLVDSEKEADVGIFNSCSVTADAEADLRQGIRRAGRRNPGIRSIVTGCAAGRVIASGEEAAILSLPSVDGVVAPADLHRLAALLNVAAPAGISARSQGSARALLRIQDGCGEHCTFCITTIARGNNRSRAEDEIIREAIDLADSHAEIVLTGTHIGSYGTDTGSSLSALVDRLIQSVPRVRFRLSSLEATEVDDRLMEIFHGSGGALTPYLHAPLQSGSDRLLKRMGRHWYSAASYRERIEQVVGSSPVFGLGADIITGFPGETDGDHAESVALVESLPFTSLHVFPFSERAGTAAVKLPGAIDPSLARERAALLRALVGTKLEQYLEKRVDYPADVVAVSSRKGITEDLLDVDLAETAIRGARFRARLERSNDNFQLLATSYSP